MASANNTVANRATARDLVAANATTISTGGTAQSNTWALAVALRFLREHWLRMTAISALVLLPCFWHAEIEADDLGSHLYNAWLVQLIRRGQAPGLWITHPWTNVLFDYMLSGFGSVFGLHTGETTAVALAVLIFFWGTFALVAAAARRAPWLLAPCIALVAYGWTFEMGFFNYYLSLGLSFFGLAIFLRGRGWERLAPLIIAPLALLANPLGPIWLAGACVYVWIASATPRRYQILWLAAAAAGLFAVPKILGACYRLDPPTRPFYFFNGADQLVLFGPRYAIAEYGLIAFVVMAIALDLILRLKESGVWAQYALPAQLYALALISVWILPGGVQVSPGSAAASLLTERFTTISAVLACCVLGAMRPKRWHLAATLAIAAVFFAFLYQDTGLVNRMERQIVQLVSKLPPNQRVLGSILAPDHSRVLIQHILDRACIGRCFSYGNYEPGSEDFRVRAHPGNLYVLTDFDLATSTESGDFRVQPHDLPAYQVYECGDGGEKLCITALRAGEENNAMADDSAN
ncbi:MAG: hypothetical protein ACRD4R_00085 [Candidatus Acidiferrales bacterium]